MKFMRQLEIVTMIFFLLMTMQLLFLHIFWKYTKNVYRLNSLASGVCFMYVEVLLNMYWSSVCNF